MFFTKEFSEKFELKKFKQCVPENQKTISKLKIMQSIVFSEKSNDLQNFRIFSSVFSQFSKISQKIFPKRNDLQVSTVFRIQFLIKTSTSNFPKKISFQKKSFKIYDKEMKQVLLEFCRICACKISIFCCKDLLAF